MFCTSYSKDFVICSFLAPLLRDSCREKKKKKKSKSSVQRICMLASTKHISLSAVPLFNDCNDTQALALWIWDIAVGTIQGMIRTQSDPLSTQSYLGRKRNEELTSLLLQCDQSFIPVKAVCQIPSLATQLGTVIYWLIFGKRHWLLYFHSFLWW